MTDCQNLPSVTENMNLPVKKQEMSLARRSFAGVQYLADRVVHLRKTIFRLEKDLTAMNQSVVKLRRRVGSLEAAQGN